ETVFPRTRARPPKGGGGGAPPRRLGGGPPNKKPPRRQREPRNLIRGHLPENGGTGNREHQVALPARGDFDRRRRASRQREDHFAGARQLERHRGMLQCWAHSRAKERSPIGIGVELSERYPPVAVQIRRAA